VEREALVMNLSFMTKLPSVKQEWNRGFGAFLRLPDFRRFSGTVGSIGLTLKAKFPTPLSLSQSQKVLKLNGD